MDERDLKLRELTYQLFVDRGRAPTPDEAASAAGSTRAELESGWRRLHQAHALVLNAAKHRDPDGQPVLGRPVRLSRPCTRRWWYANCAWDAFGVCAALHADGRIETSCPDCGESIAVDVRDQRPSDQSLLFHCQVPAGGCKRGAKFAPQNAPRHDALHKHLLRFAGIS